MNQPSELEKPEWAITFVRGALRIGMNVLEIEAHLISKGLPADDAKEIVMEMVEAAFVESSAPSSSSEWPKPVRMTLPAAVAGASVGLSYWYGGGPSVGRALLWVLPALLGTWVVEIPDLEGSDWAARSWLSGWALLLIYLAYRLFIFLVWP